MIVNPFVVFGAGGLLTMLMGGLVLRSLWKRRFLQNHVSLMEEMVNASDQGFLFFDSEGFFQIANKNARKFLPFLNDFEREDEVLTLEDVLIYLHDHAVECDQSLRNTIGRSAQSSGFEGFREVIRWKADRICLVEGRKVQSGGTVFFLSDVSTEKKREDRFIRLYQTNYELLHAVEAATSGIIITNPNIEGHTVVFVNGAFCDIADIQKTEIIGETITALYKRLGKTEYIETIEQAFKENRFEDIEIKFDNAQKGAGKNRWFDLVISPVRNPGDQLDLFIWIFTETTALKLREAEFLKAQKLEALGQISAGVAHDFNNILSIIGGYAQLTRQHLDTPETVEAYLEKILTASNRGAALTRKMLTFGRHKIIESTVIDLVETLRQQEALLRPLLDASIDFEILAKDSDVFIEGTEDYISQILMNLCLNARDAMKGGGAIVVEIQKCRTDSLPESLPPEAGDAKFARISVSDTGMGMDKVTREKIFDPFFTTKEQGKGTGLGMSVVYGLVQQMKGTIDVVSSAAKGTKISIDLPLSPKEPDKKVSGSLDDMKTLSLKGYTALIAEDEPDLLLLVASLLENLGMNVIRAKDGHQALVEQEDYTGDIDVLLTDVVMPGLNGVRLAELLQSLRPETKVIFMSGYPASGDMARVELPAQACFIAKPVKCETLVQIIYSSLTGQKDHSQMVSSGVGVPRWQTGEVLAK